MCSLVERLSCLSSIKSDVGPTRAVSYTHLKPSVTAFPIPDAAPVTSTALFSNPNQSILCLQYFYS